MNDPDYGIFQYITKWSNIKTVMKMWLQTTRLALMSILHKKTILFCIEDLDGKEPFEVIGLRDLFLTRVTPGDDRIFMKMTDMRLFGSHLVSKEEFRMYLDTIGLDNVKLFIFQVRWRDYRELLKKEIEKDVEYSLEDVEWAFDVVHQNIDFPRWWSQGSSRLFSIYLFTMIWITARIKIHNVPKELPLYHPLHRIYGCSQQYYINMNKVEYCIL